MSENEYGKRIMPQNNEAEQCLAGALLMDNEAMSMVETIVSKEDFYQRQYGIIFEAMAELIGEGRAADVLTLSDRLKQKKEASPELWSMSSLGELLADVPITQNAKYYAEIVREKSVQRSLIRACEDTANMCYAGKEPLHDIMEKAEKSVFRVLNQRRIKEDRPIREITKETLVMIHEAASRKDSITGVPSGFADLDAVLSGFQRSDLIIIGARPSVGKTAFALNIAHHAAVRNNICTAVFSLEMSDTSLVRRLLAIEGKVDSKRLRNGELTDRDWDNLADAGRAIAQSNLILCESVGISVNEMRTKCRKYKIENNLGLVIVDYLQLMKGPNNKMSENRQNEVAEISRFLKVMAMELDCPVIALSQLSRKRSAEDNHPVLSDLRESGAIEQDADVVLLLHNEDKYHPEEPPKNIMEVNVAKHRNGETRPVYLGWQPEYTRFVNIDHRTRPDG